ncbi:hypothetical protein [Polaribacter sp. Asnod6-C07]|uniref:hypothetical protein n=1 Tax=Polaribacter sp. Asnod6-C07 TaxID=3160582 RepID=UPI00386E79C3
MKTILQKTRYTFLLLTLLSLTACNNNYYELCETDEAYIHIPDQYFEIELIEQGIDSDGIINHQILKSDAEKVTRLDLNLTANFGDISDLTGLEGFTNITYLSTANQEIETVDLSFNTQLDTIYLLGNKLKNIDLSKNTNLIFADLQANRFEDNNLITGLSNATNLKDLDLSWNYLTEFSIHNQSLEVLHISHNDLVTINTDGATNLEHVLLNSNQLESADFTTNISIETLLISGNKLATLNLENNTNLTHLYISSNALTSFDVSNNNKLIDLRIDRNPNLTCIKIYNGQYIPIVQKAETQQLSVECNS